MGCGTSERAKAARGELHASSDIDLLVTFAPMLPVEHSNAYFGLLEAFESLFGREIDLLEEDAIENPYFRRSVEASRVALYAA